MGIRCPIGEEGGAGGGGGLEEPSTVSIFTAREPITAPATFAALVRSASQSRPARQGSGPRAAKIWPSGRICGKNADPDFSFCGAHPTGRDQPDHVDLQTGTTSFCRHPLPVFRLGTGVSIRERRCAWDGSWVLDGQERAREGREKAAHIPGVLRRDTSLLARADRSWRWSRGSNVPRFLGRESAGRTSLCCKHAYSGGRPVVGAGCLVARGAVRPLCRRRRAFHQVLPASPSARGGVQFCGAGGRRKVVVAASAIGQFLDATK